MKGGADKEEAEAQIGDHFYGSWSNIFHLFCVVCLRGKSSAQRLAPDVALQAPQQMLFATLHTPWSSPRGREVHQVDRRDDWRDGQHLARERKTTKGRRRLLPGFR